jgi:peptidoglycan/xylan/chitin deacetylase (PgdA/CDA1 family)
MKGPRFHILLYHGVHGDDVVLDLRNRSGKHISATRFDVEMATIARSRALVSMLDIAAAIRGEHSIPDDAVAVTFDDGFANNYTHAWPVLERHGVPATIYLSTGFIGKGRRMWSDQLEAAYLGSTVDAIAIEVDGHSFDYELTEPSQRLAAFLDTKARAKCLPNASKDHLVAAVCATLTPSPDSHPLYDFLTWEHVREMDASDLIDFGAHTVDHVSLTRVEPIEMARQIDQSIAAVANATGRPCKLFAYPEGQAHDYDDATIAHLRSVGIDHAPSAIAGSNVLGQIDPFHLRRHMVGFEGAPFPL